MSQSEPTTCTSHTSTEKMATHEVNGAVYPFTPLHPTRNVLGLGLSVCPPSFKPPDPSTVRPQPPALGPTNHHTTGYSYSVVRTGTVQDHVILPRVVSTTLMRLLHALGRAGPVRPFPLSYLLCEIKTAHVIALRKLPWHVFCSAKS
jgi:hypothetical protein